MTKKSTDKLFVDGGLKIDNTLFNLHVPRGKGYAKINYSPTQRIEIDLPKYSNTNIEAEIFAIFCGITECIRSNKTEIITDSKFWVDAINKNWGLKEERLKLPCQIASSLIKYYGLKLSFIKRELNLAT